MTTKNRYDVKSALVAKMQTDLVPGVVQAVYDHEPSDITALPAIVVLSDGSRRERLGKGVGIYRNFFRFNLRIFVLGPDENSGWTSQQAEKMLDDIEQAVADWVLTNAEGYPDWEYLHLDDGFSRILPVRLVRGPLCYVEVMNLIAEVTDG